MLKSLNKLIFYEKLTAYPDFRGRTIRYCRYRWRRNRNKPISTEVIGTYSWLADSAWRSTLLGYGDVPSQGVQGIRRRTTHAVPFPLEQKHYPHTRRATWHARGTQPSLTDRRSIFFSFFSSFSLDLLSSSLLLHGLKKFCIRLLHSVLVEKTRTIHEEQWTRSTVR